MARGHEALRRLATWPRPSQSICKSCLISLRLRHPRLASTAQSVEAVQQEPLAGDHGGQPPIIFPLPSPQRNYQIQAAVILSRPPTLTRDLTPFEKAYFLYQRRLNERLALPFTRYFYYQRDSPGDVNWKRKIKERLTPARDIGVYDAYSEEGWNDELLVGSKESEPEVQIAAIVQDAQDENKSEAGIEGMVKKGEEIEKPMERVTEADRIGDTKSLNRALTQTLYLVVKSGKDGERWRFPSNDLKGQESLHTAAERILVQSSGPNMYTWVVGNVPIGHQIITYSHDGQDTGNVGVKRFFMKARIMAGQASLKGNKFGLEHFGWLTKEEIQKEFDPNDWRSVRHILAER